MSSIKSDSQNNSLQTFDDRDDTPTAKFEDVDRKQIDDLLENLPQLDKHFDLHRKIGEGTFSSVYLGSLKIHRDLPRHQRRLFAIKHLVATAHPARVEQELRCLREIGGKHNVIGVDLCLRNLDTVVFVMPYIPHTKFSEYVTLMDAEEIRRYMEALLVALRHVHSMGVIHRDVKPGNFLYDRVGQRFQLVDFGLAQKIVSVPPLQRRKRPRDMSEAEGAPPAKRSHTNLPPTGYQAVQRPCSCAGRARVCARCLSLGSCRAARAGTAGYRAPEVLLRAPRQSGGLDVWAAGTLLLAAGPRAAPAPRPDLSALAGLLALRGSAAIARAAAALGRRVVSSRTFPGVCFRKLSAHLRAAPHWAPASGPACLQCARAASHCLCLDPHSDPTSIAPGRQWGGLPDELFSLLYLLLEPDPHLRPSAAQALQHPFITTPLPSTCPPRVPRVTPT